MLGIAELLKRWWNGRDQIRRATEQNLFPPPRCLICGRAWRYGSDETGREWVECERGHVLTKAKFDETKREPMIGDGTAHGEI